MATRKTYRVERSAAADHDLDALFDFLFASYWRFGEDAEPAFARATARIKRVRSNLRSLARIPHQGTLHPDLMPGLRTVTKDRAIFYFTVDDEARVVRVLAIFFGGQDHQREMLMRLLRGD